MHGFILTTATEMYDDDGGHDHMPPLEIKKQSQHQGVQD
jgi:hypothetical protein